MRTRTASWALSPWWGILELVGPPNQGGMIEGWNGSQMVYVVAETLRPLGEVAASLLGRALGDEVWDAATVARWEHEPIRWPVGPGGFFSALAPRDITDD